MTFNDNCTNFVFRPGKLTTVMDGSAGSSGKGKLASFITEHADNWQFACNTFMPQAGHWVKLDDGAKYFYQTFNACAYQDKYEKLYIGPGSIIELPALYREMEENNINPSKIGIHPLVGILQDLDAAFERGEVDFDGKESRHEGTMKHGSTCHGVGAARARRILRRDNVKLARDVDGLKEFMCDTSEEIMDRLNRGQAGLLEIAQGFQLSYLLNGMYPHCTSRNCTVAAGLDDLMVPPYYAGDVIINFRTFPIRINNNKYIGKDGKHLTWNDILCGVPHDIYKGNSGPGYNDQVELTWDELTRLSGSPDPIIELTSVTKLPRRVFTFSVKNLIDAVKYNYTGYNTYISLNFANYVDFLGMDGLRGHGVERLTDKFMNWFKSTFNDILINCDANLCVAAGAHGNGVTVPFIGTGANTDDMILI